MNYLTGKEENEAQKYLELAGQLAKKSTCLRHKCGCVVVNFCRVIGEGYNTPSGNLENQRRCNIDKSTYDKKVTDKTCCVHAEQRAIIDALKKNSKLVEGSRLYFMRIDKDGNLTKAGNPYCTICSKLALDVGIKEFVLWHEKGICVYNTEEYNKLSYEYKE